MSAVAAVAERTGMRDVASLDALYEAAGGVKFTPGWVPRKKPILWAEPKPEFVPAHWTLEDAKAGLDAAGRLIDVSLAERRNLVMRNPAPGANFETTRTLVCAYQMILPGEQAPSHRHSSHALRVIIDGKGSFSTVNGEKMPMETGDVVLTPGWCWHGHGHDGERAGLLVRRARRAAHPPARADVLSRSIRSKHEKVERVVQIRRSASRARTSRAGSMPRSRTPKASTGRASRSTRPTCRRWG